MEIDKLRVEKLCGADNCQQWQFIMQTLTDSESAPEVCTGDELKLLPKCAHFDAKMKKLSKTDKIAKELFVTTVKSNSLLLLMNCETVYDKW